MKYLIEFATKKDQGTNRWVALDEYDGESPEIAVETATQNMDVRGVMFRITEAYNIPAEGTTNALNSWVMMA